jgi:hypothetical protein
MEIGQGELPSAGSAKPTKQMPMDGRVVQKTLIVRTIRVKRLRRKLG